MTKYQFSNHISFQVLFKELYKICFEYNYKFEFVKINYFQNLSI